jgi:uncharacterized membrane protein YhaH (DUF805 family)
VPSSGYPTSAKTQAMSRQGMLQSIPHTVRNTFSIHGRASRSEYWLFFLFQVVSFIALVLLFVVASDRYNNSTLAMLMGILLACFYVWLTICGITLTVRRLHDQDRSGWWLFALLLAFVFLGAVAGYEPELESGVSSLSTIVYIGWLILMCQRGTDGPNKYGNNSIYFY